MIKTFSKKEESKLEEGNIKTIDNEQNVEDITVAVSTEVPEQVDKVEKDDKQAFEEFKAMYKGVIDIKCRQDFGDCEDEKLWEDTAKELFLQSKNYILVGDEYKAKEDLDDHLEKIEESKEIKTEARENDIETRINQVKEWKQMVEDAVEASDLEVIVDDILEFALDIKDINFAGEDLYSGMSTVLDNGDAEARGPVTYVRSVKRDMQNILDDFIDNYEQAFNEESLEESVSNDNIVTDEFEFVKPFEANFDKIIIKKQGNEYFIFREDAKSDEDYIDHGNKDYIEGWLHGAIKANNKVVTPLTEGKENNFEHDYMMLDRLKTDCDYYLKNGNRCAKYLWANNEQEQIDEMRRLYNLLPEKPEWISEEDINNYEKEMCSKQLEENKYNTLAFAQLLPMSFTDMVDNDIYEYLEEDEEDSTTEDIAKYYIDRFKNDLSKEDAEEFDDKLATEYIEYKLANKPSLEESKTYSDNDIEKVIKEYLEKTNGIFTDDSIYDIVEELCGESDIDKMPKDLINQVTAKVNKDNKIEEKRELPENEKEILKNNMRKVLKQHGKFEDDEELEDYIEEFMPLWIEAQENLGTEVLPLDESKELKTEDQYEMERRKGRPNLEKIAKEVFEYDDYYIDIVNNYNTEREFIIDNIAEVAAEYNLKEPAAWAVMEKIYKMAKEAKSDRVTESNVSDYTLNQLNDILQNAKEDGLGFTLQIMSRDNADKTKHLNVDVEDVRAIYGALEGLKK